MSLARRTQERILAMKTASAPATGGGLAITAAGTMPAADQAPAPNRPGGTAAAQIAMRLTHDLRRLKNIKAIDRKIAAKREMLPEYFAWVDGVLEAGRMTNGRELGSTGADEVLPTVMVWSIDTGDWMRALALASHVLRFSVPLPARYERDAATLVLEDIAEVALKVQMQGGSFPLWVLEAVEELTADIDMHDQPRAKLLKAIGAELARAAGDAEPDKARPLITSALDRLGRAQALHDRVGVKTQIKGLEKALAALPAPSEPTGDAGSTEQAGDTPAA
jgi:hypothetical protein